MQINGKNLCDSCFEEIGGAPCPYCGYAPDRYKAAVGMLPVGSVLKNRYRIGKVLGAGGFGVTYKAYDILLNGTVAVKEYYPSSIVHRDTGTTQVSVREHTMSEDFQSGAEKFCEEAKTVSRFNGNPNIVGVSDHFRENGTAYFVMEYLDGMDLKHYIAMQGGKLTQENVVHIAKVIADALIITHSLDVLHRDISPDNIFITSDGKIKLIDFGAARQVLSQQSKSLSVILKQGFAPLEQYQRKGKQGSWTDIYALGATMYYALTGKIPEDATERLDAADIGNAEDYGVDPELWAVIDKCMAVRINDRYEEAIDLKRALGKLHVQDIELEKLPRVQAVVQPGAAQSVSEAPGTQQSGQVSQQQSAPVYAQPDDGDKTMAFGAGAPGVPAMAQQSAPSYEAQQSIPAYVAQQSAPAYEAQQSTPVYGAQQSTLAYAAPSMQPQEDDDNRTVAFSGDTYASQQQTSGMQQSASGMQQPASGMANTSGMAVASGMEVASGMATASAIQFAPSVNAASGHGKGKRTIFYALIAGLALFMTVFGVLTITKLHQKKAVPYDDMAENKYYLSGACTDLSKMGMIIREMPIMWFSPAVEIRFQDCVDKLHYYEKDMYNELALFEEGAFYGEQGDKYASEYSDMRLYIDQWLMNTYENASIIATDKRGKVNYQSSNTDDFRSETVLYGCDDLMLVGRDLLNLADDSQNRLQLMLDADAEENMQDARKKEKSLNGLRLAATVVMIASAVLIMLLVVMSCVRTGKNISGGNGKGTLFGVLILMLTALTTILGVLSLLKLGKDKKVPAENYAQEKYYLSDALRYSNEIGRRVRNMAVMYMSPGVDIDFQWQLNLMKQHEMNMRDDLTLFRERLDMDDNAEMDKNYDTMTAALNALLNNTYANADLIATDKRGKVNYNSPNTQDYDRRNVETACYYMMYEGRDLELNVKAIANSMIDMLDRQADINAKEAARLEKSLNGQRIAALVVLIASAVLIAILVLIDMAGAKRQTSGMQQSASGMASTFGMAASPDMQFAPGVNAVAGHGRGKRTLLCALMAGLALLMTVFGVLTLSRLHQKKAVPYDDMAENKYYLSSACEDFSQMGMRIRNMPIMWFSPGTEIEFQATLDRLKATEENMYASLAYFEEITLFDESYGRVYTDMRKTMDRWMQNTYESSDLIATDKRGKINFRSSNPDDFVNRNVEDACERIMWEGRDLFCEVRDIRDKLLDMMNKDADVNIQDAQKKEKSLNGLRLAATVVLIASAALIVLLLVISKARAGKSVLFNVLILALTAVMTVLGVLSLLKLGKDKKVPYEDYAQAKYYLSEALFESHEMQNRPRNMVLMYMAPGVDIEFHDQIIKMNNYEKVLYENLERFSESISAYYEHESDYVRLEFDTKYADLQYYLKALINNDYEDAAVIATDRQGKVDYSSSRTEYYVMSNVCKASDDLMGKGRPLEWELEQLADDLMEMLDASAQTNRAKAQKLEKSLNGLRLAALIVMIASAVCMTVLNVIDMAGAKKAGR